MVRPRGTHPYLKYLAHIILFGGKYPLYRTHILFWEGVLCEVCAPTTSKVPWCLSTLVLALVFKYLGSIVGKKFDREIKKHNSLSLLHDVCLNFCTPFLVVFEYVQYIFVLFANLVLYLTLFVKQKLKFIQSEHMTGDFSEKRLKVCNIVRSKIIT